MTPPPPPKTTSSIHRAPVAAAPPPFHYYSFLPTNRANRPPTPGAHGGRADWVVPPEILMRNCRYHDSRNLSRNEGSACVVENNDSSFHGRRTGGRTEGREERSRLRRLSIFQT